MKQPKTKTIYYRILQGYNDQWHWYKCIIDEKCNYCNARFKCWTADEPMLEYEEWKGRFDGEMLHIKVAPI